MAKYWQHRPNTLKIELTEGCNFYCGFCGLQGIRAKPNTDFRHLTMGLARTIAERLPATWRPRIELAMHGEPLAHPNVPGVIHEFRSRHPRAHVMITTNGLYLLQPPGPEERLRALYAAGLNILALDCYKRSEPIVTVIRKLRGILGERHGIRVSDYPAVRHPSPHDRCSTHARRLILIADLGEAYHAMLKGVGNRIISNHCGAGLAPLAKPMQKRCARPFRELAIRWDGNVALCCNDWRGVYKVGNVLDYPTLEELWQSPTLHAARQYLYAGDRSSVKPCNVCDNQSFRVGLLPDPAGQEEVPKPTAKSRSLVDDASFGAPYTQPNLRPWEKER